MPADLKQSTNLAAKILASGQLAVQLATIVGVPTGGTWTPAVNGTNAAAVAYNASAASLQTALVAVNAAITVAGSAGGPYTITCPPGVPAIVTMAANALTGGTTPNVVMAGIATTIYTVPALSAVKVATFTLTNQSASAVVVSVSVVPSGGSVDGTHQVVAGYSLAAGDSTVINEVAGALLDAGAFISLTAAAATAIDYLLTGAVSS